ncbi:hypothetical protein [Flaviflexus equikiangi]|uniref:Uncharacterized protein n=1 Tax=Flaviflexus equikiangi TaxID=2758573 RepID=A0ABS2TEI2_9ACTO|nr:hypothetical protein [Flaviflexus equikiangi]MBM9433069.1 hypothetical protein [Flaviflexus equikiangi]
MMRKLAATTIVALAALSACSTDSEENESEVTSSGTTAESTADGDASSEGNLMVVEDGVATSSDGRFSLTLVDGWQAYPAPLDDRVNMTILLVSDVNNAEFAANIIGTWADGTVEGIPADYEEWSVAAGEAFTGEGVSVEAAEPLDVDGETVEGLIVTREVDGVGLRQLVYPIFTDDGFQEIAYSASTDVFDENLEDVLEMFGTLAPVS